jgi:hypothetical protein
MYKLLASSRSGKIGLFADGEGRAAAADETQMITAQPLRLSTSGVICSAILIASV